MPWGDAMDVDDDVDTESELDEWPEIPKSTHRDGGLRVAAMCSRTEAPLFKRSPHLRDDSPFD